jgi:hypothetical protein
MPVGSSGPGHSWDGRARPRIRGVGLPMPGPFDLPPAPSRGVVPEEQAAVESRILAARWARMTHVFGT